MNLCFVDLGPSVKLDFKLCWELSLRSIGDIIIEPGYTGMRINFLSKYICLFVYAGLCTHGVVSSISYDLNARANGIHNLKLHCI